VFTYLHAVVTPTAVYAASADWGSGSATSALSERIGRSANELAALMHDSDRSSRVLDPFALPAGFSPTGGYSAQ
jgi:FMN reductase